MHCRICCKNKKTKPYRWCFGCDLHTIGKSCDLSLSGFHIIRQRGRQRDTGKRRTKRGKRIRPFPCEPSKKTTRRPLGNARARKSGSRGPYVSPINWATLMKEKGKAWFPQPIELPHEAYYFHSIYVQQAKKKARQPNPASSHGMEAMHKQAGR